MNWKLLIGIILIILAGVIGTVASFPLDTLVEIIALCCGFILSLLEILKDKDKKNWKTWVTVGAIGVGCALCLLGGQSEQWITVLIGAVVVIAGAILEVINTKNKKTTIGNSTKG